MPLKTLITGGAGRLGRYVTAEMTAHAEATVMDLKPPHQEVPFVEGSVLDFDLLKRSFAGQEVVVHLAAIPNPRTAPADVTFHTNVQGSWNVLQAAEEAGVRRVVMISSDAVTGLHYNPENWGPQYLPVDEAHPLRPTEFYSLSKEVGEVMCRCYATRGKLEIVVIRPGHIVFPQEYPELADRGSDPDNYHIWTYVAPEDVAQAIRLAATVPGLTYETFFVLAGDLLGEEPTLERAKRRFGLTDAQIARPELYAADPLAGIFDISAAREKLGYAPKIGWREMFARAEAAE
ncbi:NAD(P)-dependent oxidoreductase [Paralimibaculum aggregatum]|uniref:NAD(P)-dependent oxidoreductase n=1 Tax=Paralimibaculum aggregatum TaxID=3036245 RepID=A0ABQ6LN72_9RHOB|nr:NAD(P)-dependent oxidoreductase [Limibaculum sp. NKW23]GMG83152.1 NAD(P)-dependent oxidoreductase [Limibaculum sp. NKW23]